MNAMRAKITSDFGMDDYFDDMPWHEALVPWARAYRDAFAAHPTDDRVARRPPPR